MASNHEQLVRANDGLVEIQYAYHVTNVKVEYDEHGKPCNEPTWKQLRWRLADDPTVDGSALFGAPCVFFTTTLYDGDIRKESRYPRNGTLDADYWFVKVPLTYFDNHEILHMHTYGEQITLLLIDRECAENKIPENKRVARKADKYLQRDDSDPNDIKYYSNEYNNTSYFVCFAVCEDVKLGKSDVHWGQVKRTENENGSPEREKLMKMLFDRVIDELKK